MENGRGGRRFHREPVGEGMAVQVTARRGIEILEGPLDEMVDTGALPDLLQSWGWASEGARVGEVRA